MRTGVNRALPDPTVEPTITIERASGVLGISIRGAYHAAERGEIPVVRVGRTVRVLTGKFLRAYQLDSI